MTISRKQRKKKLGSYYLCSPLMLNIKCVLEEIFQHYPSSIFPSNKTCTVHPSARSGKCSCSGKSERNTKAWLSYSDIWWVENIRDEEIINYIVSTPQPVSFFFSLFLSTDTKDNRHTSQYMADELKNVIAELGSDKVFASCHCQRGQHEGCQGESGRGIPSFDTYRLPYAMLYLHSRFLMVVGALQFFNFLSPSFLLLLTPSLNFLFQINTAPAFSL